MNKQLSGTIALVLIFSVRTSEAACMPPEGAQVKDCISCGNLEQHVERGHDLAWNELLDNTTMQLELRTVGATHVYLVDPPHSSPGVLHYSVAIEDQQFSVVNTESAATARQLLYEWQIAFDYEGASVQAEWIWRQHQLTRIEAALSTAVATGSAPYILRLFDSRGNPVEGGVAMYARLTPRQEPALAGPRDLFPESQYANEACIHVDRRYPGDDGGDGNGGGGDGHDGDYDDGVFDNAWWDWEESFGLHTRYECVPDFSNPYGSGVICFT